MKISFLKVYLEVIPCEIDCSYDLIIQKMSERRK